MIFDSALHFKWIGVDTAPAGADWTATHRCLLYSESPDRGIDGFTVFQEGDLKAEFLERLQRRMDSEKYKDHCFHLVFPPSAKEKFEKLRGPKLQTSRLQLRTSPYFRLQKSGSSFLLRDKIRVINVDDSPVILKILLSCLRELGFVEVLAQIQNPAEAVATILRLSPDIVTMDLQMPGLNGVEVVQQLLAQRYFRVLILSSLNLEEGSQVFEALNSGAFDYLQKPQAEHRAQFMRELSDHLLMTIESPERATRRRRSGTTQGGSTGPRSQQRKGEHFAGNLIWCLGASTGGTQALTEVLTCLPEQIPPTLIVQHIPPVFSRAFAESLNRLCPFAVKEAADGDLLVANQVYVAAGGRQLGLEERNGQVILHLLDDPPVNRFKPSVDYMFREVAKLKGRRVVAGLLTGMGRDGAQGLLELKKLGALTFAQDEASSAVYGMPRAAAELGAAEHILDLEAIAEHLISMSRIAKAG